MRALRAVAGEKLGGRDLWRKAEEGREARGRRWERCGGDEKSCAKSQWEVSRKEWFD